MTWTDYSNLYLMIKIRILKGKAHKNGNNSYLGSSEPQSLVKMTNKDSETESFFSLWWLKEKSWTFWL